MNSLRILITIAWRNLWRSRVRSGVVIAAMAVGIWAGIYLSGFSIGMNEQRTESALSTYVGFAQAHKVGWADEQTADMFIPNTQRVLDAAANQDGFLAATPRLVLTGTAISPRGSYSVNIEGVNPAMDTLVFDLNTRIVEGEYLPSIRRGVPAYIGQSLAEELKVQLGDQFQLNFQMVDGYFTTMNFRVSGIFKTVSSMYDKSTVQVKYDDLSALMGAPDGVAHEIVFKLKDRETSRSWASAVNAQFDDTDVESWQEVAPDLGYADDLMDVSLYIFIGIILFAITFGILNTMLMAILERKRELGMLMAVGMNKRRTFGMIVLETFFLGTVGAPLGILLGHFSILASKNTGIDLSSVGEGLNAYGMDSIVYPAPVPDYYGGIALMVIVLTLLASLYPAFKALKLNPVEAIRSV